MARRAIKRTRNASESCELMCDILGIMYERASWGKFGSGSRHYLYILPSPAFWQDPFAEGTNRRRRVSFVPCQEVGTCVPEMKMRSGERNRGKGRHS